MDNFPNDFNRDTCIKQITENQKKLIKDTRNEFYENVIASVKRCDNDIELSFPTNLKFEHRATLTKELLSRFETIIVKTIPLGSNTIVKKIISESEGVPEKVEGVTIKF
jgi:hypothetical protein